MIFIINMKITLKVWNLIVTRLLSTAVNLLFNDTDTTPEW